MVLNDLPVSDGVDGKDTLLNVERLKFADIALAFDINGNAGQTYRCIRRLLTARPIRLGSDSWLGQMAGGMTREVVLIGFWASAENQAALIGVIQHGIAYIPA